MIHDSVDNAIGLFAESLDTIPAPAPTDDEDRPTIPECAEGRRRSSDRAFRLSDLRALLETQEAPPSSGENGEK